MTATTTRTTADEVRDLLVALGGTPDAVAATLYRRNVTGDVCTAGTCPIAEYLLASDFAPADVAVSQVFTTFVPNGGDPDDPDAWQQVPTPPAVTAFIHRFDNRAYEGLIRDQHTGDPHA